MFEYLHSKMCCAENAKLNTQTLKITKKSTFSAQFRELAREIVKQNITETKL